MSQAYIYDALRTPRTKGKEDGALHEVKPVRLAAGLLEHLQERHDLDTAKVEDVILGCVAPLMDQGSCIAKAAVMSAGWDEAVPVCSLTAFAVRGLRR